MSKSYGNQIPIFDSEEELQKKIMRIVTDSKAPDEPKNPDENTVFLLYKHFADEGAVKEMREKFLNGKIGYGDAKKILFEAANKYLTKPREKYAELIKNPKRICEMLADGAARARAAASETIARVRRAMKLDRF
jgi:tryptophanyl-tRNA synthetase